ncbi:hypothetical protein ACLB2K_030506 [Fragaria x ananassa]
MVGRSVVVANWWNPGGGRLCLCVREGDREKEREEGRRAKREREAHDPALSKTVKHLPKTTPFSFTYTRRTPYAPWDKGLAFCPPVTSSEHKIYINGVSIIDASEEWGDGDGFWRCDGFLELYYIPFEAIIKRLSESGSPPPCICLVKSEFRIETIEFTDGTIEEVDGSCGVHVVMPEGDGPFFSDFRTMVQKSKAEKTEQMYDMLQQKEYGADISRHPGPNSSKSCHPSISGHNCRLSGSLLKSTGVSPP